MPYTGMHPGSTGDGRNWNTGTDRAKGCQRLTAAARGFLWRGRVRGAPHKVVTKLKGGIVGWVISFRELIRIW